MSLIVFSPSSQIENEIESVKKILKLNIYAYHIRKTNFTLQEYIHYIESIPKNYHNKLVLHDCYELIHRFNIKGVHLTRKYLNSNKNNPKLSTQHTKSKSCHNLEELTQIENYDYVFLSPLFDSISKPGYKKKTFPHHQIKKFVGKAPKPVFGLGGISIRTIKDAKKTGVTHYAVLGSVWQSENPEQKVKELLKEIDN